MPHTCHPNESRRGKTLAPPLGKFCSEALREGQIQLELNELGQANRDFQGFLDLCRVFDATADQQESTDKERTASDAKQKLWRLYTTHESMGRHVRV